MEKISIGRDEVAATVFVVVCAFFVIGVTVYAVVCPSVARVFCAMTQHKTLERGFCTRCGVKVH